MCMCPYVRIQTERHACHFPFGACQFVNHFQFRDALHIKAEDVVVESEIDLPVGLAHTCIDNLACGEACLDGSLNLATADAIDTQTCFADDAEQTGIGIGLHGIVDNESLVAACLLIDGTQRGA